MNPPVRTISDIDAEVAGEQSQIRALFNRVEKLEETQEQLREALNSVLVGVELNTRYISYLYGKVA